MDDMKQVNIEIRLADIRAALVIVWAIMMLIAEEFIYNTWIGILLLLGSMSLFCLVVIARMPKSW